MMVDVTRRGLGLATLLTAAAHSRHKHLKGHAMPTPSTLRATVQQDGTTAGQSAIVLVDGADTMVTANGVAGYVPMQDDRVLVQQVGGQVEILQFLNRTYITGQTIRTAPSGARVEITEGPATPVAFGEVNFYTGDPLENANVPNTLHGFSQTNAGVFYEEVLLAAGGITDSGVDKVGGTAALSVPSIIVSSAYTLAGGAVDSFISLLANKIVIGPSPVGIRAINFGTSLVTYAGGVSTATTGNFAHGLPSTPLYVGVMPNAATSAYYGYIAGGMTSTQFNLGLKNSVASPAAGTVVNFLWFAIC